MNGNEGLTRLNACARLLVQLEPAEDDLRPLIDALGALLASWPGSAESRSELQSLIQVGPDVSVEARLALVERVSAVLQRVQDEVEDSEDQRGVGAALPDISPTAVGEAPPVDMDDWMAEEPEETEVESPLSQAQSPEPDAAPAESRPALEEGEPARSPSPPVPASALYALPPDADAGLVMDFVAEGLEYLDQAEEALLSLEADPGNGEAVNVTFRAFHTIKGVAAFLELEYVTTIAHETETLLARVREGSLRFTGAAADLFLTSADVLRGLLSGLRETVSGGRADAPAGLDRLLALLSDPGIGDRVARNESLGVGRSKAGAEDEPLENEAVPEGGPENVREGAAPSSNASEDSVRVRTERLDRLVDLVGELVIAHSMISQDPEVMGTRGELNKKVSQSQKILRELQDLSTSIRMVPLKPAFHKISRVVRDVTRKSGKKVSLVTSGDDTELDRGMVAIITDSLVHMVRNSIDHGIEDAQERRAAGKPDRGTLRLAARQAGGNVVLEIEDDGKGLDRDRILAKAIERGLVAPDRTMADDEVFALIFQPGFSTAEKVTDLSGRGVGMDVVRRAVESLRGRIEIRSERGKGTKFSIFLPLTLAITDGMLIRVGSQRYIIPTVKIQFSFRPADDDLWTVSGKGEMVMVHGSLLPVNRLHQLFGINGAQEQPTRGILIVVGEGSRRSALLVDELLGQQQFVVKPLSGLVAGTPGIAGGAILGDGGVGLILDPEELSVSGRHRNGTRDAA